MKKEVAYPAIFTKDGKYYCVEFPDLPGCLTQGETVEEAYHAAREALAIYLDSVDECNEPTSFEKMEAQPGEYLMLIDPHADGEIFDAKEIDIAEVLDSALKKSGYTKYRVAKIMDVSESYINLICNGKRVPSPKVAQRLGALLDIDWRIFYAGE